MNCIIAMQNLRSIIVDYLGITLWSGISYDLVKEFLYQTISNSDFDKLHSVVFSGFSIQLSDADVIIKSQCNKEFDIITTLIALNRSVR